MSRELRIRLIEIDFWKLDKVFLKLDEIKNNEEKYVSKIENKKKI